VNYRGCLVASASPEFAAIWHRVCDDAERERAAWVAMLRAAGVRAAHPNDGWVDREACVVDFCYPYFNDGCSAGDTIALGSPREFRVARLIQRLPLRQLVTGLGSRDERWRFGWTEMLTPLSLTRPERTE